MNQIRKLRESRGLTMRQVAKALNLPYTTYVNYEKGTREPNSEFLIAIADFFDVTVDYVIGRFREKTVHFNGVHVYQSTFDDKLAEKLETLDPDEYDIVYRAPGIMIIADHDTPMTKDTIAYIIDVFRVDSAKHDNTSAQYYGHTIPRDFARAALWGDCEYVDDHDLDDVLQYADFVKERKAKLLHSHNEAN